MRIILRITSAIAGTIVLTVAACATPKSSGSGDSASRSATDTVDARQQLARLEADARALAKMSGCSASKQCRSAPLGERACGGPRTYLVYCAATTDSVALFKKLGELSAVEKKFNQSAGMMSTCEFRMPPQVAVQGGSCREVQR
jgi:hypothetical protein